VLRDEASLLFDGGGHVLAAAGLAVVIEENAFAPDTRRGARAIPSIMSRVERVLHVVLQPAASSHSQSASARSAEILPWRWTRKRSIEFGRETETRTCDDAMGCADMG